MDSRSRQIIKLALLFALSNLEDVIEHFNGDEMFEVNGEPCVVPTESEIEEVLKEFQDVL